jgi:hypothetical protein
MWQRQMKRIFGIAIVRVDVIKSMGTCVESYRAIGMIEADKFSVAEQNRFRWTAGGRNEVILAKSTRRYDRRCIVVFM